jgi:hypothetical protein
MDGGKSDMRTERVDEVLLLNYLLGRLPEEEQVRVEDRAFRDADYLGVLEGAEADLIDSYIRGELSQTERRHFERRFLTSPQRRTKVEHARALARVAAESKASQAVVPQRLSAWQGLVNLMRGWNPALQFAAGMAVLICISGASWLTMQNTTMRSQVTALEVERRGMESRERSLQQQLVDERARAGGLAAQAPKQPSSEATRAPLLASLVFVPGLSRAETPVQQLALSSSAQLAHIEIQLEARDDYPRYRAELHTKRGEEVLIRGNLARRRTAAGSAVVFDVPASALAAGDYELALRGMANGRQTDIGYYYFRVQKQ